MEPRRRLLPVLCATALLLAAQTGAAAVRLAVSVPPLAEFAEREKAERDADWAAEDRLDRRRSWQEGL